MPSERDFSEFNFNETIVDHYTKAAEELLYAYQTNKEASRHYGAGALKAAKYHGQMAQNHSFIAHEHITEALKETQALREKISVKSAKETTRLLGKMTDPRGST